MEEVAPEMGHIGWGMRSSTWMCGNGLEVTFYAVWIAFHTECRMRIMYWKGRGRCDSQAQLDLG
jgi:hypothetical protein